VTLLAVFGTTRRRKKLSMRRMGPNVPRQSFIDELISLERRTYQLFDSAGADAGFAGAGLLFKEIEKHVNKIMKTHRCALHQEKA
jgi:hypothetical protein